MFRKNFLVAALVVGVIVSASFLSLSQRGDAQTDQRPQPQPTPNIVQSSRRDFPIVQYANQRPIDIDRRERGAKYDRYPIINPEITANDMDVAFVDGEIGLSALPVNESDVIVTGKVVSAEAHLSPERKSVYSEFRIEIQKTYKNTAEAALEDGKYVRAERTGGIVVYPSGYELWHYVFGQRMPLVGERYLFFLTRNFPTYGRKENSLHLLTAYRLSNGKVYPLDNITNHPITTEYKGKDESRLCTDLEKKLNVPEAKRTYRGQS